MLPKVGGWAEREELTPCFYSAGMEARALFMPGKCSTTEQYLQPLILTVNQPANDGRHGQVHKQLCGFAI